MKLADKVACITGGGGEIARAIASRLAQEGAAILAVDVDGEKASATAEKVRHAGGQAEGIAGDVGRESDASAAISHAVKKFGGLDILVYTAAAVTPDGDAVTLARSDWDRALEVNLTGAFLFAKHAVPEMQKRGGGVIINVASQLGHLGVGGRSPYCTTKAALIRFSQIMAIDFAGDNIRVNSLSPGAVHTERSSRRYGGKEAARRIHGPKHLLGRPASTSEIASAALFLASEDASFMTGTDMLVDGGYTAFKGTLADQ